MVVAVLLSSATPAAAFQQAARPVTTTAVPTAPYAASTAAPTAPKTYAECLRSYVRRADPTAYCRRLFPDAAPSTTVPGAASTPGDSTLSSSREPVDITPQVERLIDAWRSRPRTPPATPRPPADPLAVIPDIQAACAAYAATPERWRRCTADGWRQAGLRGQPPLALQTPPAVEPSRVEPSPVEPSSREAQPARPPLVRPKPPVQTPPTLTPRTVQPDPVAPAPVVEPQPPPVVIAELPAAPTPPAVTTPPPTPPQTPLPAKASTAPVWLWLVALAVAAGGGFGLARWLGRARPTSSPVAAAPCAPEIALVPDPGVVVLKPDGSPRAGMAVSLRFAFARDAGEVRLDYPTLETAP